MTHKTTDQARAAIAKILGEDADAIRVQSPHWLNFMKEGVIVAIHIRRWRAKAKLSFADLGITVEADEQDVVADLLTLGDKKLAPSEVIRELTAIESGARKHLERCSYETHWGRFIPATRYPEWKAGNDKHRARYFEAADAYIAKYDEHKAALIESYAVTARAAYRRLKSLDPESVKNIAEEQFVETFMTNLTALIPDKKTVRDSFGFEVELNYIPLPSLLAADEAKADGIRRKDQEAQSKADLKEATMRARANAAWTEARTKEQMVREMNAEVLAQAKNQKAALVDTFMADLVKQLRTLVYEATTDVLATIKSRDQLHPRSIVQLRGLIEQVGKMNFFGDAEVDTMIAGVKGMLNKSADDRNLADVKNQLRDIATLTRASLIDLGETPRTARGLGIASVPPDAVVRAARRNLGLDEAEAVVVEPLAPRRSRMSATESMSVAA